VQLASDLVHRFRHGAEAAELDLDQLLSPERWRPRGRWTNAEHAKALGFVQQAVTDARYFLGVVAKEAPGQLEAFQRELRAMLAPKCTTIDTAWDLYNGLRQQIVRMADAHYVLMLLEHEKIRNGAEGKWHRWDDHFAEKSLDALIRRFRRNPGDEAVRAEAANRLTYLYKQRAEAGRERRARAAEKCRFMTMLAPLLLVLIAAVTVSADLVSQGGAIWREIVLAGSAGALGSVLAGTLKLRDRLVELDDLRAFGATLRVQPLVGATMGIVVLVILQGDLIRLGGDNVSAWPGRAVLAFLAGFSEPFFLKVVDRLAVIPDKTGAAAQAPPEAAAVEAPPAVPASTPNA
jgi:hypothetical protein